MDRKLNVCLLNDSFPPVIDGVSNAVLNYATILQRKYGDVTVVTPDYPDKNDEHYDFTVERYPSIDTTKQVGYRTGNALDLNYLSRLYEKNFDILHTHCPIASTYMARLLRRVDHRPVVLTYHTKFDIDIKRAINNKLIQQSAISLLVSNISACDDIWCVSRGAGENLRSLGYTGMYTVMPNGVDFEKGRASQQQIDEARKEYGIRNDVPVYLFVGRMMWYKGIKIILDALRILKNHGQDFQMVFVGKGLDKEEIEEYVRDLQLEKECVFTGAIEGRDKLKTVYCCCDLFLFPSTFDTNGLVVREAAASSLASVLVTGSCAAEDVTDGVNALLIEENAESMAKVLMNPSNSVDFYHRLGENASNQLYFSWEQAVDKAYQRYLYVIDRHDSKPFYLEPPHLFDGFLDAWSSLASSIALTNKLRRTVDSKVSETTQKINDFIDSNVGNTSQKINDFLDTIKNKD